MKKKLLFILPSFGIGGTTVSTKNLILKLDPETYDMYLMPMNERGALRSMFDDVKQIKTPFVISSLAYDSWTEQKGLFGKLLCAILRFGANNCNKFKTWLLSSAAQKIIYKHGFDTVVACQEGQATAFVQHFNCNNKVAWIRCDYDRLANRFKSKRQEKDIYKRFDSIVCVSEITAQHFKEIFPEFSDKTFAINNPQNEEYIKKQSQNDDHDERFVKYGYTLLSIGRIDPVKRFTHIPRIANELIQKGLEFRWYLVGDGNPAELKKILSEIKKYNVENQVIWLGLKTNPHFYISNSDVLVCLSSSEACPRVINEAKVLNVPVVSADFATAKEYIVSESNGLICPIGNMSNGIYRILTDQVLKERINQNIKEFRFDNSEIIEQLEKIL